MDPRENIFITKHRQIIQALTAQMQENLLKPYDRLPTEKELCEYWHASRSTVRKAMDQLEDRGKIFRVPGKGSFVAHQKITHHTSQIMSFMEKMKAQGLSVKTQLIRKEIVKPSEEIATALKLAPPFKALKLQRLRIVKDEPLALQTAFMSADMFTGFLKEDLESQSMNKLFQEKFNISLSRSEIWIEAPIITREEKKLLGNPPLSLFLAVVSVTYDQDNKPVRFTRGIFRGDRVRLRISDASLFDLNYSGLRG